MAGMCAPINNQERDHLQNIGNGAIKPDTTMPYNSPVSTSEPHFVLWVETH